MLRSLFRVLSTVRAVSLALREPGLLLPATGSGSTRVSSDVSYEFLARWDADKLNKILTADTPKFARIPFSCTPATNAGRLYRSTYASVVSGRGNKPVTAIGLLAIPVTNATSLRWSRTQHGTVYGKQEVPSYPGQSPETQLMIAQFAGPGLSRDRRRLSRHGRLDRARRLHGQGQPSAGHLMTCCAPAAPCSIG
jgi:hypothetical protein